MTTRETTPTSDAAVLAFLDGWRELQQGDITAGGSLVVRYEPARFSAARAASSETAPSEDTPAADGSEDRGAAPRWAAREIVGYARFLPGGQIRHATLRGRRVPRATTTAFAAEIAVPPETRAVELWFQCTDADGETIWDSRFGENYRFDVVHPRPRPTDSLQLRPGAIVDPALISVREDAAIKENAFPSRPGYPAAGVSLQTNLHVAARVQRPAEPEAVWVDVHFFDAGAALVHGDTIPLRHVGEADSGYDLFMLDGMLYQGSVATPGSVTPRPDVRSVQYRLYCRFGDRVVTDGGLHRCFLATDAVSG